MSLISRLFGRKPSTPHRPRAPSPAVPPPVPIELPSFAIDRDRMFDLVLTGELQRLAGQPWSPEWEVAFFGALWNASIALPSPTAYTGPDGFPYLRLDIPAAGAFESNSLANVAGPCVEAGIGAVLFPAPDATDPVYVMSLGVLGSLLRFGDWRGDPVDLAERGEGGYSTITLERNEQVLTAAPSADFLSPAEARALDRWLKGRGLDAPAVQLMVSASLRPTRTLVINVRREVFETDDQVADFCQRVLWHLPPSRSITLMPDGFDESAFTPLAELAERA